MTLLHAKNFFYNYDLNTMKIILIALQASHGNNRERSIIN
jgi:hypothetical protein